MAGGKLSQSRCGRFVLLVAMVTSDAPPEVAQRTRVDGLATHCACTARLCAFPVNVFLPCFFFLFVAFFLVQIIDYRLVSYFTTPAHEFYLGTMVDLKTPPPCVAPSR